MSTSPRPKQIELQEALARIEAEWIAFQRAHKMLSKPKSANEAQQNLNSPGYSQGRFWSYSDHIADSQRLNEIDRLKG